MSAGTLTLTNNSTAVTGVGTTFTADLKVNDFVVVMVGGVTYTLGVTTIGSATALTLTTPYSGPTTSGTAWTAVPNAALVGITAQIAADVSRLVRGANLDKTNWQQVYSASGNITVTLIDGSTFTGPSWNSISVQIAANTTAVANKAAKGANSDITSITGLTTPLALTQGGTGGNTKAAAWANIATFGTTSGTAAQGNDTRLNTVDGKTGGAVSSAIVNTESFTAKGGISSATAASYGVSMSWSGTNGNAFFQNNNGGGFGHYQFRVVNATNTAELTMFTMNNNGLGQSPAGWASTSDEHVKDNITEIDPEEALKALLSWRSATWKYFDKPAEYNPDGSVKSVVKGALGVGLIAQDVEKYCPNAVINSDESSLFITDDGELFSVNNIKSLNTSGVSAAYTTAAIKALVKRMEDQDRKIEHLYALINK